MGDRMPAAEISGLKGHRCACETCGGHWHLNSDELFAAWTERVRMLNVVGRLPRECLQILNMIADLENCEDRETVIKKFGILRQWLESTREDSGLAARTAYGTQSTDAVTKQNRNPLSTFAMPLTMTTEERRRYIDDCLPPVDLDGYQTIQIETSVSSSQDSSPKPQDS